MPRADRLNRRFGSQPESEATGPKGARSLPTAPEASGFKLPTLGPTAPQPTVSNTLLGYTYRDNETFSENLDRVQVIQRHYKFSLYGYNEMYANGSALPSNAAVVDITTRFWPYVYTFLHEMAQKRDGYKATTESLHDGLHVMFRDELLISMKINIRVLAQLFTASLVNEGLKSTLTGMRTYRSRILRDLEASNRLVYPAEWDKFITFWSHVYSASARGPFVVNLFLMNHYLKAGAIFAPTTGAVTAWAALPDLTSSTDVGKLLDDIELAQSVLERYNVSDANHANDLRLINSIYAMMGFPTPQTPIPAVGVDGDKFHAQFMRYGMHFLDTKGVGADVSLFWPDMRGNVDNLINVDFGPFNPDELDWIGAKGSHGYAFEADDDDTPGYTTKANDLTSLGLVIGTDYLDASCSSTVAATKIWTQEDGWATLVRELDYTAAAGCQAHIWSIPDITVHPESWRVIMSEESEEAYLHDLRLDTHAVQIPVDHFGQAYRKWLYAAYKIPYIT